MNNTISESDLNQRFERNNKELKKFKFIDSLKIKDYVDVRVKKDL